MEQIFTGAMTYFNSLPGFTRVLTIILTVIFFISIFRGIQTRWEEGGLGAGISLGIMVSIYFSRSESIQRSRFLRDLRHMEPGLLIPLGIVGFIVFMFVCLMIIGASFLLAKNKKLLLFAAILRIIGTAPLVFLVLQMLGNVGNAGFI